MRNCDLHAGAAKLEMALKTLRITLAAVDQQWNDAAKRKFWEEHVAEIDPHTHEMFEAISRMSEAAAAAAQDCESE
jgi:hypothetical protein